MSRLPRSQLTFARVFHVRLINAPFYRPPSFNEDKALSQDPRPYAFSIHIFRTPTCFECLCSSGLRNTSYEKWNPTSNHRDVLSRAVGMETSIGSRQRKGKKGMRRKGKAAAFCLMHHSMIRMDRRHCVLSPRCCTRVPDMPYASTRSKEDVSRWN